MHTADTADMMFKEESSDQSILGVMTRFVQAVNAMDETVLIPMRLKDLPEETNKSHKEAAVKFPGGDMYAHYYMLNAIKKELVSGPRSVSEGDRGETPDLLSTLKSIPVPNSKSQRGQRCLQKHGSLHQSDSETSLVDSTMSSDSEIVPSSLSDEDSESEDQIQVTSSSGESDVSVSSAEATDATSSSGLTQSLFRHHLQGLHEVLKQLTNNAQHVTNKYQEEIGELPSNSSNASQLTSFALYR